MTRAADLRFVQLGALALRVNDLDPEAIVEELHQRRIQAPDLISQARLVLDIEPLGDGELVPERLTTLAEQLEQAEFALAGLLDSGPAEAAASILGLPLLGRASDLKPIQSSIQWPTQSGTAEPAAHQEPEPDDEPDTVEVSAPSSAKATTALRHDQPIRSGQKVYARDRDLIVDGSVSAGAEVIADGSIHVYGSLRGRALAGASGDEAARVYSLDFQAELVAVAGLYKVFEELPEALRGARVQVWLENGQLRFSSL